jgi:hypothetical protein
MASIVQAGEGTTRPPKPSAPSERSAKLALYFATLVQIEHHSKARSAPLSSCALVVLHECHQVTKSPRNNVWPPGQISVYKSPEPIQPPSVEQKRLSYCPRAPRFRGSRDGRTRLLLDQYAHATAIQRLMLYVQCIRPHSLLERS